MKKTVCTLLALLFVLASTVIAQGTADALKNLERAIKREIDSKPAPKSAAAHEYRDRPEGGRSAFAQIQIAIANGEIDRADQQLAQLAMYFTSDEVQQQILKLAAALKQEQEAKQNTYAAEVNAALKQASDAVRSAKSPEDLDGALKNLSRFRNQGMSDRFSEVVRSALGRVEPSLTFLKYWQDYLAAQKSGSAERARQSLQNLSSSGTSDLIPRSQVLAELQKYPTEQDAKADASRPEQIDEIVAKVKNLDEVADAIKELRKIQGRSHGYGSSDPVTATLNALVSIEKNYREFQAGLPTRLEWPPMQVPDLTSPAITPLRVQLLLLILPRYLNAPADLAPKPRETVHAYLQRVTDEARARADSALMTRARDAQRFFCFRVQPIQHGHGNNVSNGGEKSGDRRSIHARGHFISKRA